MKDWTQIAAGLGLAIPATDLERAAASLDRIEAAFRPLVRKIPIETEPAYIAMRAEEDDE